MAFQPIDHQGICVVHRRAFGTLLKAPPSPQQCIDFHLSHEKAFQAAAREKILLRQLAVKANFHLTSRDIDRQLRIEVALPPKVS